MNEKFNMQHFLEHSRLPCPQSFKHLFLPLLEILYNDEKVDERDWQGRGCRIISDDDLLNTINQFLKMNKNGMLTDSQVQFLEIATRSSQTASRNRSTCSVAAAEHEFLVHCNHRMLGSGCFDEK